MDSSVESSQSKKTVWSYYHRTPLYLRIFVFMLLGMVVGLMLGVRAELLGIISDVILRLLGALAPPLILIAVVHVLMTSDIPGKSAGRLASLLLLNTIVAILIGLTVANVFRPGDWSDKALIPESVAAELATAKAKSDQAVESPTGDETTGEIVATPNGETKPETDVATINEAKAEGPNPFDLLVDNIPRSLLGPLGDKQNVIGVIFIAIAFGVALRRARDRELKTTRDLVEVAYDALIVVLHWIIDLVPLGVFCIVAKVVGTQGFAPFKALGAFVVTVLIALLLQTTWYLIRIRFGCWARPMHVIRGMRDALVMAFSTGSSTATMPVTYACLQEKVGLREQSASLGGLVGANFNNDGTALYEAVAALFIAQLIGIDLSIGQQVLVVLTSIVASVGAAGIPEAGIVTMTLVFTAVGLPTSMIALLLTVDWFLDRCRTTINVLGDVNVSCLLDGKTQQTVSTEPEGMHEHILPEG